MLISQLFIKFQLINYVDKLLITVFLTIKKPELTGF
jgi:hypothetical protein